MINLNVKKILGEIMETAYKVNELVSNLIVCTATYGNCKAISVTIYKDGFTMDDICFSEMVYWDTNNSEYNLKLLRDRLKGMLKDEIINK